MECEYLCYFEPIVYAAAATECLLLAGSGFIAAASLWCCQLLQTTVEAVG